MRTKNALTYIVVFSILAILMGCNPTGNKTKPPPALGKTDVGETGENLGDDAQRVNFITVSILPQKYFVERIGGDHVIVNVMVGPGDSPHDYEPSPEQMKNLSQSFIYFSIGVEFEESWLEKFKSANPDMVVVDMSEGVERVSLDRHEHGSDEHEENGEPDEHEEGHLDPHIWTSPHMVKHMADNIFDTLVSLDPSNEGVYQANLDSFISDIDALDEEIINTLSGVENRKFIVFHPSWGYFARDYDLEQVPIEVGGSEPSAQELAALIKFAQGEDIHIIFAQPEFNTKSAETIAAEVDGDVLLISPLAPDWLENIKTVAETLAAVLER